MRKDFYIEKIEPKNYKGYFSLMGFKETGFRKLDIFCMVGKGGDS